MPPGAPTDPLSAEAAIERAISSSPKIKALRAAVSVAKQRKSAATDLPDPEGIATFGNVDDEFSEDPVNGRNQRRYGGRVYLPNPFLMVPGVNAKTADFHAAQADLEAARWNVENDVRRLFAEILYLSEDRALTEELAHQYGLILQDARARVTQGGAATASDIVTAVQRQLQAQHDMDQSRYRWQAARRELAGLLDMNLESLQLSTNAPSHFPLPEPALATDDLLQDALRHREDVAALHWRTLAAKSAYVEARNVKVPWIKDVEAVNRQPVNQWWVELQVNVPIFSWTLNKEDTVKLAESNLAEVNESNGMQMLRREIRDAVDEFELQRRQQKRNAGEISPLLAEMRQTLDLLKRTPNVMPSQVAATEAQITESLRLEREARWLYELAQLNLERAVGAPLSVVLNGGNGKL